MAMTAERRCAPSQSDYRHTRKTPFAALDPVDPIGAALLDLAEAVSLNSKMLAENSRMLDAIIAHLQIPYAKAQMGFEKDCLP